MSTFARLARAIIDATEQAETHRACARESQRLSREAHALAARLSADLEPILGRLDPGTRVIYGGYLWWIEDGNVLCERPLTARDLEDPDSPEDDGCRVAGCPLQREKYSEFCPFHRGQKPPLDGPSCHQPDDKTGHVNSCHCGDGRVYLQCDECGVSGWYPVEKVELGMPPHNCGGRWRPASKLNLTRSQIDRLAFEAAMASDWWPDGEEEEED